MGLCGLQDVKALAQQIVADDPLLSQFFVTLRFQLRVFAVGYRGLQVCLSMHQRVLRTAAVDQEEHIAFPNTLTVFHFDSVQRSGATRYDGHIACSANSSAPAHRSRHILAAERDSLITGVLFFRHLHTAGKHTYG